MADLDELLTTEEAAAILRQSPKTLENWRWEKRGPAYVRVSTRAILYRRRDLMDYIDARTVAALST